MVAPGRLRRLPPVALSDGAFRYLFPILFGGEDEGFYVAARQIAP